MKKSKMIAGAVLGGLALAVAVPTIAQAHTFTAAADCEGYSASAEYYDAGAIGTVTVDGVTVFGPATFNGHDRIKGEWTTDRDTHTLQVIIDSNDDNYDVDETFTAENCGPSFPPPVTEAPGDSVQTYECEGRFVIHNKTDIDQTWNINGHHFFLDPGETEHTRDTFDGILADSEGNYVIQVNGAHFLTISALDCPQPPVGTDPAETTPPTDPGTTPVPEVPPTDGEVTPPVYEEAPVQDCPADAPVRVEDGSCVPEEFFATPSAPAPTPVPTQEGPSSLPQTGAEDYAAPLTIFAVFLVLMAGGFFVADYRKRKANGEHVDAD